MKAAKNSDQVGHAGNKLPISALSITHSRKDAIGKFELSSTIDDPNFNGILRLASTIGNMPLATIAKVNIAEQWNKLGIEAHNTMNTHGCEFKQQAKNFYEVRDTLLCPVFENHPLVMGNPRIRYFAGVPVTAANGDNLGTLCLIDYKPGKMEDWQVESLVNLSMTIAEIMGMRKNQEELGEALEMTKKSAESNASFLSTMSHEIRTPLNAIIGIAHVLLNENPRPEQISYLETLKFSANNLMVIVNDILDYNKIEAGKIVFESIPMDVIEVVNSIRQANLLRAEENGNIIKIRKDEDLPNQVLGDPVRLSQILNNLLSNAIKFTRDGLVIIEIMAVQTKNDMVTLEFKIIDNGIGISEKDKDRMFGAFTQGGTDTTRKYGGTGLGLSITKNLVELQGGQISFESKLGKGSIFKFELTYPIYKSAPKEKNFKREFEQLNGRILIAEDNRVNAMIARKIIENWGLKVEVAENGREAVDKVLANINNQYDLVLMDLQMPDIDGYEATNLIKDAGLYDLPIIAFSASVILSEQKRAYDLGMSDYITKPFNPTELYEKLRKHLYKRQSVVFR